MKQGHFRKLYFWVLPITFHSDCAAGTLNITTVFVCRIEGLKAKEKEGDPKELE
jgi:hypothetical protein